MDSSTVIAMMQLAWTLTSPIAGAAPEPVAKAIAAAATDKPLFAGPRGAEETAALMVAVARYESGFRQVAGDCKGKPPGWSGCGKLEVAEHPPQSFCFAQIHLPGGARTAEGWSGDELMGDPTKCAVAMRELLRASIKVSPADVPLLRYAGTASAAKLRFSLARKLLTASGGRS
jgi:hypothetical protein